MDFARSAMQALEIVAKAEASQLLILSDVNRPGMSGLEPPAQCAAGAPRSAGHTAYGGGFPRRKAVECGAAGLFTKPIDFPERRVVIDRRIEAEIRLSRRRRSFIVDQADLEATAKLEARDPSPSALGAFAALVGARSRTRSRNNHLKVC